MNQLTITALDARDAQTNTEIGMSKMWPYNYAIYTNPSCFSALHITPLTTCLRPEKLHYIC